MSRTLTQPTAVNTSSVATAPTRTHATRAQPAPTSPHRAPAIPTTIALLWPVANNPAENTPATLECRLTLAPTGQARTIAFHLSRSNTADPVPLPAGTPPLPTSPIARLDGDLLSLDLPGLLSATLRLHPHAPPHPLYARTPLLVALGIRGGCIERPTAAAE
jgi:hypothetical protein